MTALERRTWAIGSLILFAYSIGYMVMLAKVW
jgi:hypothetical protein